MGIMQHGGELFAAAKQYGIEPDQWLDLSTGINPLSFPVGDLPKTIFTQLPDPDRLLALEQVARKAYRVPEGCAIVGAGGSEVLIQMLPHLVAQRRVCIFSPTYGSHGAAWRAMGHDVHEISHLAQASVADVIIVVNPNNPDGRRFSVGELKAMADMVEEKGGLLIIDEAYGELKPENSFVPHSEREGVIVLRSLGKFYGLAGLRLGFAIGLARFLLPLRNRLGAWPVNGPALHIGSQALKDEAWQQQTLKQVKKAGKKFEKLLKNGGLTRIGGTSLFHLVEVPDGHKLYHYLANQAILTRPFQEQKQWLRLGLTCDEQDLKRLELALEKTALSDRTAA